MVVAKIFLENKDSGMFPKYYDDFQKNRYQGVDIKQVSDLMGSPEAEDEKWTPRIPNLMIDPSSEKLVDIPKNAAVRLFCNEKSGTTNRVLCLIKIQIDSFCDEGNSFVNFMKRFWKEGKFFVHLRPFDNFVPRKILFSAKPDGTIGTPKWMVDRPSKPKLGFYLNDFLPKLNAEIDKNDPLSSNQVDDLKEIAPRLQMHQSRH